MWSESKPSAEDIREYGLHAVAFLREHRRTWFRFWRDPRADLYDALSGFMKVVYETDPSAFTEKQFAVATNALNRMIAALESHLAQHVHPNDTSQCWFLGDTVCRLKDARNWLAQGYSPNPVKRPSDADLEAQMYAVAEEAFKSFA
jgi:hypothetical protein